MVLDDGLEQGYEPVHVVVQVLVADARELVEDLKAEVAVLGLGDDLDCLVDEVVAVLGFVEDVGH